MSLGRRLKSGQTTDTQAVKNDNFLYVFQGIGLNKIME